jgi:LuxR family maltose regulon positive regulatory protein
VPHERRPLFEAMLATARLTLARWRGDYSAAVLAVPAMLEPSAAATVSQISAENDVRAVALMTLGIVETWAGAGDDAERHLREAAELARRIGRPYIEQGCLAHLAVAVARHSISAGRELALQALDIPERYGWQSEPVAPMVFGTIGAVDVLQAGSTRRSIGSIGRSRRFARTRSRPRRSSSAIAVGCIGWARDV